MLPDAIFVRVILYSRSNDGWGERMGEKGSTINARFIRSLSIGWEQVPENSYLRGILALTRLAELEFTHDITIFTGENGTGKSTLLEAIAVAAGFNREGGTLNFMHSSYDDVSELHKALTLVRGFSRPKWGQYLRAESFYNVATLVVTEYAGGYRSLPDMHAQSHGESFLSFMRYAPERSLLILDEPEAALSPRKQLELASLIENHARNGSQFIIATQSPIILGIQDAQILSFDGGSVHEVDWGETDAVRVMRDYLAERLG